MFFMNASLNRLRHLKNVKSCFSRTHTNNVVRVRGLTSSSSSKKCVSTSNWKQNGTPEIIFGTTILSLLLIDTLIQKYYDHSSSLSKKAVLRELELAIDEDEKVQFKSATGLASTVHPLIDLSGKEKATLYKCQIIKIPKYFDGTKSLKNVELNDVIQVIEEFVGPDSNYHLCKIEKRGRNEMNKINSNSIIAMMEATYDYGWFPTTCLKKL